LKVLIIGGTGVISRCIVEELLGQQHEVVLFNRGKRSTSFGREVEVITGDRYDYEQFAETMRNRRFDAVIDMISFHARDAESTVSTFGGQVEQMIFTSSVAAYKRPYRSIPTREESEELFHQPEFAYAFQKAEMERYLQRQIQEKQLPVTIIRPSLTYGIGGANIGVLRQNVGIVDRIRKGKKLVMFGDGTVPWQFTFAPDLAKGFAGVVGNRRTFGESYHITNEEPHVWEDLYREFGSILGIEPSIVHIPSELLYMAKPELFNHLWFEKSYAGVFDNSKIKRDVPGWQATISLRQGLCSMVEWYEREGHTPDPAKDQLEDQLVGLHEEWAARFRALS
jgi:nucleoside-diphosphate-sugar epimerase